MEKELYFTRETLAAKTGEFLAAVHDLDKGQRIPFSFATAALLVMDMQQLFFKPQSHAFIPSAAAIVPQVEQLIDAFSRAGRPLFLTRHLNTASDAGGMSRWWRQVIRAEDEDSALIPDLDAPQAEVIRKTQYDAFFDTPLKDRLRQHGVSQVVVCGVMTHLCCETTARSAFVNGFDVFFVVDGTATIDSTFHLATLRNLAHGFAVPVAAKAILDFWAGRP